MSAKQQLPDATYDLVIELYKLGNSLDSITGKLRISRGTIYTVLRTRGVPLRGRAMHNVRVKPLPEKPKRERGRFDHFKPAEEFACQCGGGCGLTFRRTAHQRGRRFAPDCPVYAERRAQYMRDKAREQKERKALLEGRVMKKKPGGIRPKGNPEFVSTRWCEGCAGLPHRRPENGDPCACGLRFAPDIISERERFVIQRSEHSPTAASDW